MELSRLISLLESEDAIGFFEQLVDCALEQKASDIHIEPQRDQVRVRFRTDGLLHTVLSFDTAYQSLVVTRVKVMADMDIGERRLPLDGRIEHKGASGYVDLRVSSLPTVYGEKIEVRLLNSAYYARSIDDLGFSTDQLATLKRITRNPNGLLMLTGPTGSGKTTTLYALLSLLNDESRNISTIENPVEYKLDGINQVQVNEKSGMTFERGLRALLRQDPDVIMVGEARDNTTAQITVRAAITGHFVLSTLHTTDAISAIPRLSDMGVEPYLIASAVTGVASQRLVRKLCPHCRETVRISSVHLPLVESYDADGGDRMVYKAVGCEKCHGGYLGRMGIMEVFEVDGAFNEAIKFKNTHRELAAIAKSQGFQTLFESGLARVYEGGTSMEELIRVTFDSGVR